MENRHASTRERTLAVVERPLASLKPWKNNPRTHSKKQIRKIADSLKQFGWTNPVLVNHEGGIIAGHGRIEAAKLLGWAKAPTIALSQMSEAEKRAYVIADNRLAEEAGWDEQLLAIELQFLIDVEGLDFDVEITGFEMGDIDRILGTSVEEDVEEVELPDESKLAISRAGDIWSIGRHRIICGNSLSAEAYEALLGSEKAAMIFTDPPYNVPVDGHVSGLGNVRHREFAMASGEMSKAEFTVFLREVFGGLVAHSADGSIHFVCMDWRHIGEMLAASEGVYSELKNLCVWAKTNAGMGSFYRSQHELVFAFKAGRAPHVNNFGLGEKGRHRSNLWTYAGANTFRWGRMDDLKAHPTVKPSRMVADAIVDCSRRNDLILDVFAGSGATLVAAEQTGRCGRDRDRPALCRSMRTAAGEADGGNGPSSVRIGLFGTEPGAPLRALGRIEGRAEAAQSNVRFRPPFVYRQKRSGCAASPEPRCRHPQAPRQTVASQDGKEQCL